MVNNIYTAELVTLSRCEQLKCAVEAVYLAMLAMLTHLQDTVFATGPLNLCLETPGPFSPWQCQSVKTPVRSCPTVYLIPPSVPDMLFGSKNGYFPTVPFVSPSTTSNAC